MKVDAGLFSLALAGFAALAAAQPHGIKHRHVARNVQVVTELTTQYVTVTGVPPTATGSAAPSGTPGFSIESDNDGDSSPHGAHSVVNSAGSSIVPTSSASTSTTTSATASSSSAAASSDSSDSSFNLSIDPVSGKGVDSNPNTGKNFPDGTLSCDTFPSAYGAIPMTWVTKQGWSGIQTGNSNGDAVGVCVEGALCSYACPAGFSKSQWPADQPSDGESRGGLLCQGGKLHLTRSSYPQLCQPGAGGVTVQNKLSKTVSVCRTDYPGKIYPPDPMIDFVLISKFRV